jgi:hypothetical protein
MSDTDTARNAAQIAYWNSEAGPRWVAMQERMDAMLAPLMTAALDRARPAVGEIVLDVGWAVARHCWHSLTASVRTEAFWALIFRRLCSTAPASACGTAPCVTSA